MENGNYIKLNRQLLEWRYWYSETAVKLWILILMKANWKDGWFMGNRIQRGSLATSMSNLAIEAGCSEPTVRRWLAKFEEDGQITRKATNRYTQINVINYGFYQDVPDESDERVTNQMTEQATEQVTNQMTEQVIPNRRRKEREEGKKERRERGASAPTLEEIKSFVKEEKLTIDPVRFFSFYEGQDWKTASGYPIKDWRSKARAWQSSERPKRKEELPDYYNAEPIREDEPQLASKEEIERVRALLMKGAKKE